jgi:hypothetical protein
MSQVLSGVPANVFSQTIWLALAGEQVKLCELCPAAGAAAPAIHNSNAAQALATALVLFNNFTQRRLPTPSDFGRLPSCFFILNFLFSLLVTL